MARIRMNTVRWSAKDMNINRFVDRYGNQLPVLLLTMTGFSGGDDVTDISNNEVSNFAVR